MKAGSKLLLLRLSLVLVILTLGVTEAFPRDLTKKPILDTKALTQLETFISDNAKNLEDINKSLFAMVKEQRASICCYDVVKQEDKLSLSLRSALYTATVAVSRLQDAAHEYRQGLNRTCSSCYVPPEEVPCCNPDPSTTAAPFSPPAPLRIPTSIECGDDKFRCVFDGNCVHTSRRCNGFEDCTDGSDETGCDSLSLDCGADELKCISSGDCLPGSLRCDGDRDCSDGSDEKNCLAVRDNACERNTCSHTCVPEPWSNEGFRCTCPEGMELHLLDSTKCVSKGQGRRSWGG